MEKRLEVGIIGLGKFGSFLGQRLVELGHTVIGLDADDDAVRRSRDTLSKVYKGDGTDPAVLEQLGFSDLPHAVVTVGEAMEASILVSLNLVELGVPEVWTKAVSFAHEKVLRKIGATNVFFPERYGAHQLALRMSVPGLVEYLPVGRGVVVQRVSVDKWAGQNLIKLDLTNRFGVQIVAVRKADSQEFTYLPRAGFVLDKDDEVVLFVQEEQVGTFEP